MLFFLCKRDLSKTIVIPCDCKEDGTITYFLTGKVLHALTKPKLQLNEDKPEYVGRFQSQWYRFLKKIPQEMKVLSLTLIHGSIKSRRGSFALKNDALKKFLEYYPEYEMDSVVFEYLREQVENRTGYWWESNLEVLAQVKPSCILPAFNELIPNDITLIDLQQEQELDKDVKSILNSNNICYILCFADNKYYIGSTLSSLTRRIKGHSKEKGMFEIHTLIQVLEGHQISSRTVETALQCCCSELLNISIKNIERGNSNEGYTVEFNDNNSINDVIYRFLLSQTYNLKDKIRIIESNRINQVSNFIRIHSNA